MFTKKTVTLPSHPYMYVRSGIRQISSLYLCISSNSILQQWLLPFLPLFNDRRIRLLLFPLLCSCKELGAIYKPSFMIEPPVNEIRVIERQFGRAIDNVISGLDA